MEHVIEGMKRYLVLSDRAPGSEWQIQYYDSESLCRIPEFSHNSLILNVIGTIVIESSRTEVPNENQKTSSPSNCYFFGCNISFLQLSLFLRCTKTTGIARLHLIGFTVVKSL